MPTPPPHRRSHHRQVAPRNVASSGALIGADLADGVAIFSGYDLRAGTVRSARVTIRSAAPSPKEVRLCETEATDTFAAGELELFIDDVSEGVSRGLYRGTVGGLPAAGIDLGRFDPGEERTYRFAVLLGSDSSGGGQGRGADATYRWCYAGLGTR